MIASLIADHVPGGCLLNIMQHLDSQRLLACTAVSTLWRLAALDNPLWMARYESEFSLEDLDAYHNETLAKRAEDIEEAVWHSLYVSRRCMRLRFGEVYEGETWKKESGARFSWIQLSPGVTEAGKRSCVWGKALVVASPAVFPVSQPPGLEPTDRDSVAQQWHRNVPLRWSAMRWSLSKDRTRIALTTDVSTDGSGQVRAGYIPWSRKNETTKANRGGGSRGGVAGGGGGD